MKIKEILTESVSGLNRLDDPRYYESCVDSWTKYYGHEDRARSELDDYKNVVDGLIHHGGKVYRVIFADSPEEIRMNDLGSHWTTDSHNIDDYLDSLWSNYGKGKKNSYVVVASVGPNNISNDVVDISGNPEEKEVNINDPSKATYQAFEYRGKQFGQQVREGIDQAIKDTTVPKIYVDLDGVLADFESGFAEYDNDINKLAASGKNNIYNFYKDLPMLSDGEKLIAYLVNRGLPFTILSSPIRPYNGDRRGTIASERAKRAWVRKHLGPQHEKSAIINSDKYHWATSHGVPNILIDDMTRNTTPWKQQGGLPILHRNYADTVAKLDEILSYLSKKT
jgi:hypothetical protein